MSAIVDHILGYETLRTFLLTFKPIFVGSRNTITALFAIYKRLITTY